MSGAPLELNSSQERQRGKSLQLVSIHCSQKCSNMVLNDRCCLCSLFAVDYDPHSSKIRDAFHVRQDGHGLCKVCNKEA